MESYTVLARKYRPSTFKSVVGQDHITNTLRNAIKNKRVAHAFLFCGSRGVGKTTCARILAKTINCENLTPEGEACNECQSCKAFLTNRSFNIYELDAASNNSVDDIRLLNEQVRIPPQTGQYKIYIIDEVHMLSQSAFNAFLKTLEEPPNYAVFILATTEKHKIIPTILSRCQIFDFKRIQVNDIAQHLREISEKENLEVDDEALHMIAQKADGALRDALSLFDRIITVVDGKISYKDVVENLSILDYNYFFRLTDYLLDKDISSSLLLFKEILDNGFDGHDFLVKASEHMRDLLVSKDPATLTLMEQPANIIKKYQEQASKTSLSFLLSALNILNQFDSQYKMSKNQRLHVELALMKLCHINELIRQFNDVPAENIKKKTTVKTEKGLEKSEQKELKSRGLKTPQTNGRQGNQLKLGSYAAIKSQVKKKIETPPQEDKDKEEIPKKEVEVAFDEKKLLTTWNEFIESFLESKPFLKNSLKDKKPEINGSNIKLFFEHRSLAEAFTEVKTELAAFIKKKLDVEGSFTIEYEVTGSPEEEKKKYLVSPRDIFKDMAERNPNVLKLKDELGLDL